MSKMRTLVQLEMKHDVDLEIESVSTTEPITIEDVQDNWDSTQPF